MGVTTFSNLVKQYLKKSLTIKFYYYRNSKKKNLFTFK